MKNKQPRLLKRRKALYGVLFLSPWILGVIPFFILPLFSTIFYSLGNINLTTGGVTLNGIAHYVRLFTGDPDFVRELAASFRTMLLEVPLILVFGLFFAMILNQKFRGRMLARAILFLPVIVTSGVVIYILQNDSNAASIMNSNGSFIQMTAVSDMLTRTGLSTGVVSVITDMMSRIFDMIWKCGVQSLLFLGALQSVSPSFYEAASVEGASAWEKFWKITFPSITPILLIGIVYTIIDSFTYYGNNIMLKSIGPALKNLQYSYAAAMSIVYSALVMVLLGLVFWIVGRRITYTER